MKYTKVFAAIILALGLLLATGCVTIATTGAPATQPSAQDPLVGKWEMTRISISPQIPAPNLVINQVIPEKATWQITRVNGVLKIDYDGSDTWYKTMGINITKKPVAVTEGGNKNSCTFTSGGNFYMDKLPTLVTSLLNRQIEQISFDFDDNVQLSLTPDDRLAVTITVDATGRYYSGGESGGASWSTFNQSGSVIYQGIRKQ